MQLTETSEGESGLQIRLDEAERRAHEAEVAAQNAQATLARTLLEAARVEAVVTARVKAESEAKIEALRSELGTAKGLSSRKSETLSSGESPKSAPGHAYVAAPATESSGYRPIILTEWDRPADDLDDREETAQPSKGFGSRRSLPFALTPVQIALPAIVAVLILAAYDAIGYVMTKREMASSVLAAAYSTTSDANGTNWLLYMPVERRAVSEYLGGNAKPTQQLAVKNMPATQQ